jgi:hypothetical protein
MEIHPFVSATFGASFNLKLAKVADLKEFDLEVGE